MKSNYKTTPISASSFTLPAMDWTAVGDFLDNNTVLVFCGCCNYHKLGGLK